MTDDRPEPAKRLEQARVARGFATAKDAAKYFGWSYATYAQHERGERGLSRAAGRYAAAYRISEGWLLTGEGQGPDGTVIAPPKPVTQIVPGSELVSAQKMPVYAAAMGGEGHIIVSFDAIDQVKRPSELENVRGGYGLLIKGTSMIPALWDGDMALVNPHLTPTRDTNVILYHTPPNGGEVEAIVKHLLRWTDREWYLKQWNPVHEFTEFRQEWPICHRVVGKYDRR
ncbi:MAG TPA: S24 family peptidase [Pseudolabrys sp.]|nr:S24 family peptidase [Pseudolabrys sp.]